MSENHAAQQPARPDPTASGATRAPGAAYLPEPPTASPTGPKGPEGPKAPEGPSGPEGATDSKGSAGGSGPAAPADSATSTPSTSSATSTPAATPASSTTASSPPATTPGSTATTTSPPATPGSGTGPAGAAVAAGQAGAGGSAPAGAGRLSRFPDGPAVDPAGSHHERRIRSFRPRRGRVTPGQGEALRRLWSRWGLDIDGLHRIDLGELFGNRELPVVLEIGFGMGEATAQMAAADPGTGILAADVHTPGQGNLLALVERAGLSNVRVANGDAIILLREMLAPEALSGLRVYFPDPWPKKRHHKRRLIQPEFLALAATRLKPGALLHCATDWEPYAEQMLEVLTASPYFENTQLDGGFAARPDFRPLTKFEGQGIDKGHRVRDLLFRRVPELPAAGTTGAHPVRSGAHLTHAGRTETEAGRTPSDVRAPAADGAATGRETPREQPDHTDAGDDPARP